MPDSFTEQNYFSKALQLIAEMHNKKAQDYTNGGEFDNFIESARFAGINTDQAIENLIGTKNARLASLRNRDPVNESKFDTYFDRAVYSVIAMAYQMMLKDSMKSNPIREHLDSLKSTGMYNPPDGLKQVYYKREP